MGKRKLDHSDDSGKTHGNKVKYTYSWVCVNEDFEEWHKRFETSKNWQKKCSRNGFSWYDHNCLRYKRTCGYSKSADGVCRAKMKVPMSADEIGLYRFEFNDDGHQHFESEFMDDSYDNFVLGLFEEFHNHASTSFPSENVNEQELYDVPGPSNAIATRNDIGTLTDVNVSTKQVTDVNEWAMELDLLAKSLSQSLQLSSKTTPPYLLEDQPAQVISVAETNGEINWEIVKKSNSNPKMIFAKVARGSQEDKYFCVNFNNILTMESVKQVGVYHYFIGCRDSPSPEEQFQTVVDVLDKVGFDKQKHLFAIAVQTERNVGFTPYEFTGKLFIFINLLIKACFMRPIIYCNNNSWKQLIDPSIGNELFSKLPLWIAHWRVPTPDYPRTWKSRKIPWWMWHYTDKGEIEGIINPVYFSKRNESYTVADDSFCSAV